MNWTNLKPYASRNLCIISFGESRFANGKRNGWKCSRTNEKSVFGKWTANDIYFCKWIGKENQRLISFCVCVCSLLRKAFGSFNTKTSFWIDHSYSYFCALLSLSLTHTSCRPLAYARDLDDFYDLHETSIYLTSVHSMIIYSYFYLLQMKRLTNWKLVYFLKKRLSLGPVHTGRGAPCNMRMQIMEHTAVNGSVHTGCTQICLRVLCERGLTKSLKWNLIEDLI